MYLIAGLGNPTRQYEHTRHNVGFDVLTRLADTYHIDLNQKKFQGICGTGVIEGEKVLLLKPQTYMNLSGNSIGEAARFFKLDPSEVIVILDDIALEPGYIRIRKKGSAGGHNGLKDIIAHLGTEAFPRIRVGVGEKPAEYDLKDYVLGHFPKEDLEKMDAAMDHAVEAAAMMVRGEIDAAMNQYNKKAGKE